MWIIPKSVDAVSQVPASSNMDPHVRTGVPLIISDRCFSRRVPSKFVSAKRPSRVVPSPETGLGSGAPACGAYPAHLGHQASGQQAPDGSVHSSSDAKKTVAPVHSLGENGDTASQSGRAASRMARLPFSLMDSIQGFIRERSSSMWSSSDGTV